MPSVDKGAGLRMIRIFGPKGAIDNLRGGGDRRRSGLLVAHNYHAFHGRGPLPDPALDTLNQVYSKPRYSIGQPRFDSNENA